MKNSNPLKYFNDQADARKKAITKAALGMNVGDPPYSKPEYWSSGDSSLVKQAMVDKLKRRYELEKQAGYFTNTGEDLKRAVADRDKYATEREAYMKATNSTPREWSKFSPMIQPKEEKPFRKRKR